MTNPLICGLQIIILTLLFSGCENRTHSDKASSTSQNQKKASQLIPSDPAKSHQEPPLAVPFLSQPTEAIIVELPTEALPVWRQFQSQRPILVILTDDPFLQPIPNELMAASQRLAIVAPSPQIKASTAPMTSNPTLLSTMTLSTALAANFFSEIVWVVPTDKSPDDFSLAVFTKQLQEFGAIEPDEASSFRRKGDHFQGMVRKTPFSIVLAKHLPGLQNNILLHIDLSFFGPLYKNEIITPLFPTVLGQLTAIHQARWPVLATTVSLSNVDGTVPLDSRFMKNVFSGILRKPALLIGAAPSNWQRQKDILYLENIFQYEKILELALAMEQEAPNDANIQYALYKAYRLLKMSQEALIHLDKAVALDPVYALEYVRLAPLAGEKGRPDEAARMLHKAGAALPDHPFIQIDLAHALQQAGDYTAARQILGQLIALDWSPSYYPAMPETLRRQQQAIVNAHE